MTTKIDALINELEEAEKLASNYSGGYSNRFLNAEEFHLTLKDRIEKLKSNKKYVIEELWFWFAPTCSWDDFIGSEGFDLGVRIFSKLDSLMAEISVVEIDLKSIDDIDELHSTFKNKLNFPDFYGRNWDAFWDSIMGLVEMPEILKLDNWKTFELKFEEDSKILDRIISDFNDSDANRKIEKK